MLYVNLKLATNQMKNLRLTQKSFWTDSGKGDFSVFVATLKVDKVWSAASDEINLTVKKLPHLFA